VSDESAVQNALHDEVWDLIPWLVNGRASFEERAKAKSHLEWCVACAREYTEQRRVFDGMQADDSIAFASEASFQKLAARLDAEPTVPRAAVAVRWVAAASLIAAVGLVAWGGWMLQRLPGQGTAGAYVTLTAAPASVADGARLRVVFTSDLTVDELQRLLHSIDAYVSNGPTEAGVFTLTLAGGQDSPAEVARRLAVLRADASVRFAEPVAAAR
jgi:hypothetical protein